MMIMDYIGCNELLQNWTSTEDRSPKCLEPLMEVLSYLT